MAIRSENKQIADAYDDLLIAEGIAWKKPEEELDLDRHGVDVIDKNYTRIDTKYPASLDNFYFQISKILNDDSRFPIFTEEYWYIFHGTIYKYSRKHLKDFVKNFKDKWKPIKRSDGYEEVILMLTDIDKSGDPMKAEPFGFEPLPKSTAELIENDIIKRRRRKQ